jgi:flagellar biosynthesis regulator FlbT
MKYFVIPVITGVTGIVTKGLKNIRKEYQESIQQILYKTTIFGALRMIRKLLKYETLSLNGGVNQWFKWRSTR